MKTNQVMIRKMGDFNITQRTSDGMFNATTLLKQWNGVKGMKKEIKDYFDNSSTKDFVAEIIKRENLNGGNYPYLTNRGKNGGTWMSPILFIDFAMWINPTFKYDVLKFVYDEMIKYRNEAGDAYKELSSAIAKIIPSKSFMPTAMQKVSEALNFIVFNSHEKMIRNKIGDEAKQRDLCQMEKKIADLINDGFIKDYNNLILYLKEQYRKRYFPRVFNIA